KALHGVDAAGVFWQVPLSKPLVVSGAPEPALGPGTGSGAVREVPVIAASPGLLTAAGAAVRAGPSFNAWAQAHRAHGWPGGAGPARAIGIGSLPRQGVIHIDDGPGAGTGVLSGGSGRQSLVRSVVLPSATALELWGPPDERAGAVPSVLIQTRPGAAAVVA